MSTAAALIARAGLCSSLNEVSQLLGKMLLGEEYGLVLPIAAGDRMPGRCTFKSERGITASRWCIIHYALSCSHLEDVGA